MNEATALVSGSDSGADPQYISSQGFLEASAAVGGNNTYILLHN